MIGSLFTVIYFFSFKYLILRFDVKTPGREDEAEDIKLFTKADYKNRQQGSSVVNNDNPYEGQALQLLEALGGSENIAEVNNCATRLRISVKDEHRVMNDATFRQIGAHGVVRNKDAIQVIIGLSVPQVRDSMENLMKLNA
ncbi:MAG: glucose PTS transporter subunit EIIB [Tolumonas sp.]